MALPFDDLWLSSRLPGERNVGAALHKHAPIHGPQGGEKRCFSASQLLQNE